MKKITVALSIAAILFITACGNSSTSDTTTNMPDSGYEPRTDTTTNAPVTTESLPHGAVGEDSIYMGQTNTAGVPDSTNNKKDSTGNK